MKLLLPQNAFQGGESVSVWFPDSWEVEYHEMLGDLKPALTQEQIIDRLRRPYGSLPLCELARGKRNVCIVFDDITRGTPTRPMAQAVLGELAQAGIRREQIRFLCALGTHGAHNREDHVHKLGEEIVSTYPIYNHNCYENNVCIGKTAHGMDICVNAEFMRCDMRIGIGAITPHTMNGFGGGAKLVFPGLASIETIAQNHRTATDFLHKSGMDSSSMTGNLTMRGMREEIESMSQMTEPFFKVDCIYNSRLELIDLYAGNAIEEYYAGIPAAQQLYAINPPRNKDIVVVNSNAKATEATVATGFGAMGLKESGGDVVLVDMTKRGQATHYLFGSFGRFIGGRMMGEMPSVRPQVNQYICWMPYPDHGAAHWLGEVEKQVYVDTWPEALTILMNKHGNGTKVSVVSDATLAYSV